MKGGTGKSTAAMHIITWLLRDHHKVASLDIDARQGTLTRYIENRRARKIIPDTIYPYPIMSHFLKVIYLIAKKLKKKIGKIFQKLWAN